jgi:dipeptidyl aminopeptidase/acylaminoacyl peptidase
MEIADGPRSSIWMYELATGSLTRVSPGDADSKPVWSADGRRLSYASRQKEERHIMWQPVDASAPPESLVASRDSILWPGAWSPDDSQLIYVEDPPTSLSQVKRLRVRDKTAPEELLVGHSVELQPNLSPDGKWLAYVVFDRPPPQVFVRPFGGGAPRQITPEGGGQPRWSRTGREIFVRRLGDVVRIPIQTTPGLVVGKPEQIFKDEFVGATYGPPDYDVTADGQRLLTIKVADSERAPLPIRFIVNWFDEINRRVPAPR